jgi:hypothetical protein
MIFLVDINPFPGQDRTAMDREFRDMQNADEEFRMAVGIQRILKKVGRDEVSMIMRAENLLFLEQALQPFESRAEIVVTPVIDLE